MKNIFSISIAVAATFCVVIAAEAQRTVECLDCGWRFSLGHAADAQRDFGCGTEYFNYLTKAASIHNEGPYALGFDDGSWQTVDLPHDWVVDLPFAAEASHSHGYKCVGWQYPESSVGWYRRSLDISAADRGRHLVLRFDGIFRDAQVWVNGFWLGREPSGYAAQIYDITDYVDYEGDNVVVVRADASMEEGWYYEGAGIYRHVWLERMSPLHVAPLGIFVYSRLQEPFAHADIYVETEVENASRSGERYAVTHTLLDSEGRRVAFAAHDDAELLSPRHSRTDRQCIRLSQPHLWCCEDPYMYSVETRIEVDGIEVDRVTTPVGIRSVVFDPDRGLLLNGRRVALRGVNLHQDHAGVGAAIPDELYAYRLGLLKDMGCNAIRTSHNPASPVLLDLCDREGFLVVEENRLMGIGDEHMRLLERMIRRDRNHPSIILWSVGNEEWGIEGNDRGARIARTMCDRCHVFDPTRQATAATAGGVRLPEGLDVVGYNYLVQNPIDEMRARYPERCAMGSEETSGCGTRGVYADDREGGRMQSLNRAGVDGVKNVISRGWRFYDERPWLAGEFFWTGLDYRGEPNPLSFPATGSSFGIMDYCGFAKDEYYFLRAWWREDQPQIHVLPHWNWQGHEGETVEVWVYTNCDEAEIVVNGRRMERKAVERGGYASWQVPYKAGYVEARGLRGGRRVAVSRVETTGEARGIVVRCSGGDGLRAGSVVICDVDVVDARSRVVPTASPRLRVVVGDNVRILGMGNGDSAWRAAERPADRDCREFCFDAFNGHAQIIVETLADAADAAAESLSLTISAAGDDAICPAARSIAAR